MFEFILCAITNLFRIYLTYCFAEIFLGKTNKSKITVLCICCSYYLANITLYWTFHTAWINIACNLIGVSAIAFLFTRSIKVNLFVTVSINIINIGCDILATLPYINYKDGQSISQAYEILTDFYVFVCWFVIRKIITTAKHAEHLFNISLISVPILSIALIDFMIYYKACDGFCTAIVGIGLLIINFFMFYLYNQLLHSMSKHFEAELLEQRIQIYSNQLNVIMQNEEITKALRHDIKHHMNELMILAQNNKTAELMQYLSKMNEALQNPDEIVASGNMEVDSVLNYHLHRAKEELVTVTANAVLPEDMKHSFDVIVVLGNLLDNAIEAAGQSEKKYLGVDINFQKGILFIQIDNSYVPKNSLSKAPRQTTSATNGRSFKHQGLGLKNVQRIVDAHNGKIEINEGSDLYSVKVMLYMSQSE